MPPRLIVEIVGDTSNLERSFKRSSRAANEFNRNLGQASRGAVAATATFRGMGRSVAFASGAFLGGAGFVAAVKSSVNAASNLSEQLSKSNVVFGKSAGSVEEWSKTTVSAMGLAQDQALATASSFGALLRPLGLTGAAAAEQSKRLTQLGADLASFYNTSVQDALDAIRSGLVGESEPLRRYGVLLSEARVQARAMADTGKTVAASLTQQEKVLARQALIFRDSAQAQGDFARTSGGLANQQRILSANLRQLQIGIGQALIPDVLKVTKAMNDWLSQTDNQKRVTDAVREAVGFLHDAVAAITPFIRQAAAAAREFSDALGGTRNALKLLIATFAAWKVTGVVANFQAVGGAASVAASNMGLLRTRLLALRAIGPIGIGVTVALTAKWITEKLGIPKGPSGLDIFKAVNDEIGFTKELAKFGRNFGIGGGGSRNTSPSAFDTLANMTRNAVAGLAATGVHAARNTPRGVTGAGTAGRVPTGLAALSRIARNQIALAQARTPGEELAALAEQREILANQIRSVRSRLAGASGQQAAKLAAQLADLEGKDTAAFQQIASIHEAAARGAAATAKRARDAEKKRQQALFDTVRAAVGGFAGSLGVKGGPLTVADVNKAIAKNEAAQRKTVRTVQDNLRRFVVQRDQSAQFRALGLSATGGERTPSAGSLLERLTGVQDKVRGSTFDTANLTQRFDVIRKVLTGAFGKAREEVRRIVKGILDDIDQQFKDRGGEQTPFRHLSPNKLAAALLPNASVAQRRQLAAGLATVGPNFTVPSGRSQAFSGAGAQINVHGPINVYGVQNVRELEDNLARRAASRARVRRGAR